MAEKSDIYPLPLFLTAKTCVSCKRQLKMNDYEEIGFYYNGEHEGKLFVRYKCESCETKGNIIIGDENFNLEKLCTFIIINSKFLNEGEKIYWQEHFFGEENK